VKTLIENAQVLLLNGREWEVQETSVCIDGDTIVHVGSPGPDFEADEKISGYNRLLMPGLINAHNHSYMTLFRNYADDLPFQTWLFERILPLEDQLTGRDCYWGSQLAIMEMLRTGTTCFFDMYMFIHETSRAVAESGIRACLSRGMIGEGQDAGGQRRLREATKEMEHWQALQHPRIHFMLSAHAPYTCDPEFLRQVVAVARTRNVGLCVHLAESREEVATIRATYDCTPTEYMDRVGFFDEQALVAHGIYLTDSDLDILAARGVHVVTNPVSNMKLANGFAPLGKMLKKGISICLGTDSAASNNTQNLFKDLQSVVLVHKGHDEEAEMISAGEALRFATVNGAHALGLAEQAGAIRVGMKADLVLLDLDQPQFHPRHNLVSALAYSATGHEVVMTMVDGRILYEDGAYTTIDGERVFAEVSAISRRLTGK
jgi:5-methylthioadenosine/S-adenosylhomocysteine deaminase